MLLLVVGSECMYMCVCRVTSFVCWVVVHVYIPQGDISLTGCVYVCRVFMRL